ncbi:hydrogenase assembly protein HupF [Mycolicibacterium thermoresistibile]
MITTAVDRGLDADLAADLAAAALTLARRFSAEATMWCLAPGWEPHAQHVAVEFVHPVIVGKRALPAVAVTGADPVGALRMSVRPGDIVLAVCGADHPDVRSAMLRAPAWGATTVWIGHGARPPAGAADHVLWLDDPDPRIPATGGFVLLYHLLWELTHVCFEHPGLLREPECTDEVCITCSDDGCLAEVIDSPGSPGSPGCPGGVGGVVARTAEGTVTVDTSLVGPVDAGDLLLVHAGLAISKVTDDTRDAVTGDGEVGR